MYNVMVTAGENAWEEGVYVWHRSRILEFTSDAIRAQFQDLTEEALERLAELPTLLMYEQDTVGTPRIGKIRRIQQRGADFRVVFEFDDAMPPLPSAQIAELAWELGLEPFEFSRTHWAVKGGDLYAILANAGVHAAAPEVAAEEEEVALEEERIPAVEVTPAKVFLVHGRDEAAKQSVARFLETKVGLQVIILSERPNGGRSILTKFEQEAEGATYAIALMTGDDSARLRPGLVADGEPEPEPKLRPRQNVIFELGFFIGRLGPERVCALVGPGIERPSDYDGIVYVHFDGQEGWQKKLVTELHAANVPVSASWWKP
jgi:predicted nucleotide-binding protein